MATDLPSNPPIDFHASTVSARPVGLPVPSPAGLVTALVLCATMYGVTIGVGRHPLQALYSGVKFPLLLLLVPAGNALLNSLLSRLWKTPLTFREVYRIQMVCFADLAIVLASLCPVFLFLLWSLPDSGRPEGEAVYRGLLLLHVGAIAVAGVAAHRRQFDTVLRATGVRRTAVWMMTGWLAGNLLLGGQLAWNLRPFFGNPNKPVQFFRPDAFEKNFFEGPYERAFDIHPEPRHIRHD